MLLALALAVQADPVSEAAKLPLGCAVAAVAAGAADASPMRMVSQYTYLAMHAARVDRRGKPFLTRLNELSDPRLAGAIPDPAAAKTRAAECDRRYPLARTNAAARLPAAPYDRDLMCLGILSLLKGAAESMREDGTDDGSMHARVSAAIEPYNSRLTDEELARNGHSSEAAFTEAMGTQLDRSLELGNPETIARACGLKDA